MFTYKLSLLAFVLAVGLSSTNTQAKDTNDFELTTNVDISSADNNTASCENDSWCLNGGTCNNSVCICIPGTSGPYCEIIEGCENKVEQTRRCGNPDNVYCVFNATSQTTYCRCKNVNFLYDKHYKICKECDCGYYSTCTFVNGKKTCSCGKDYGLFIEDNKEKYCEYCSCGMYSNGCTYYGYGKKICECQTGFGQQFTGYCSECDCGPHGDCSFYVFHKVCFCEKGYTVKDGKCEECDCGKDGVCEWDDDTGEKRCNCKTGFGIQNGTCVECGCYMDNELVNCTFSDGKPKCSCPDGFEENNSTCIDINECMNETACPPYSICKNTPGSYECTCKNGFRPLNTTKNPSESDESDNTGLDPKVYGCEDINECVEMGVCTRNKTTNCINTPGSYQCLCKDGYSVPSYAKSAEDGCIQNEEKSWTFLYVILGVIGGIVFIGLLVFAVKRWNRR